MPGLRAISTSASKRCGLTSQAAVAHLSDIDNHLTRALIWGAAWDMTRDGEMPARDYLALVEKRYLDSLG